MSRKVFILLMSLLFCGTLANAQGVQKSELQQRAEAENEKGNGASARFYYIRAYEDYADKGQMLPAVECGTKASAMYYKKDNLYKEAFDLLRRIDQTIAASGKDARSMAALHYLTSKERMQMYMKMRRAEPAHEHMNIMEGHARTANDEGISNDLLYNKAIYYYTFGQNDKGNAVFKEMAAKLTTQKEYDKVDEVYKTLIANGMRSGSANMVAQSYKNYIVWKDSVTALKTAEERDSLEMRIADNENMIIAQDQQLSSRQMMIVGLGVLAAILAAALVLGAIVLMRFVLLTSKQKKTIRQANENNALKAKFISNISALMAPTLNKLDARVPEVKALQDFSAHIQTLSELESTTAEDVEMADTAVPQFCENLVEEIRGKVKSGVAINMNAPKMSARINKEYVSHILSHLLRNAAVYTPEGGAIALEYKKRGAHKFQFLVSNTGVPIPAEKREDIFKPFLEIKDLTTGDGLGLPICKLMAQKMKGDLTIDPEYTKGTRFVLDLYS